MTTVRELVGDQGEVTDLRFVGPPSKPSHLAVATNSAVIRLYSLASRAYEAALYGHTDMVLALDSIQNTRGQTLLASGSKDCSFRLWKLEARTSSAVNFCLGCSPQTTHAALLIDQWASLRFHTLHPKHLTDYALRLYIYKSQTACEGIKCQSLKIKIHVSIPPSS